MQEPAKLQSMQGMGPLGSAGHLQPAGTHITANLPQMYQSLWTSISRRGGQRVQQRQTVGTTHGVTLEF